MDKENIDRLNSLLEQRISFKRNFLLGIVTGIGTAIGALLIGSVLVGFFLSKVDYIPFLRDIFPTETVLEYVEIETEIRE